jgi:GTP cyclohydrolase I
MTGHNTTPAGCDHLEDSTPVATNESVERAIDWNKAQEGTRQLLEAIGEDPESEPLRETWQRRVPAMLETLSEGTRPEAKPTMRTFGSDVEELVVKTGIQFQSLCEHHLLPYTGSVHLAYRPNGAVCGLSKLVRYVRWQSRQPSIQEGLTQSIASGLAEELDAEAVIVEASATHLCEVMRGVESETVTTTRATVGDVRDTERDRFEATIQRTTN